MKKLFKKLQVLLFVFLFIISNNTVLANEIASENQINDIHQNCNHEIEHDVHDASWKELPSDSKVELESGKYYFGENSKIPKEIPDNKNIIICLNNKKIELNYYVELGRNSNLTILNCNKNTKATIDFMINSYTLKKGIADYEHRHSLISAKDSSSLNIINVDINVQKEKNYNFQRDKRIEIIDMKEGLNLNVCNSAIIDKGVNPQKINLDDLASIKLIICGEKTNLIDSTLETEGMGVWFDLKEELNVINSKIYSKIINNEDAFLHAMDIRIKEGGKIVIDSSEIKAEGYNSTYTIEIEGIKYNPKATIEIKGNSKIMNMPSDTVQRSEVITASWVNLKISDNTIIEGKRVGINYDSGTLEVNDNASIKGGLEAINAFNAKVCLNGGKISGHNNALNNPYDLDSLDYNEIIPSSNFSECKIHFYTRDSSIIARNEAGESYKGNEIKIEFWNGYYPKTYFEGWHVVKDVTSENREKFKLNPNDIKNGWYLREEENKSDKKKKDLVLRIKGDIFIDDFTVYEGGLGNNNKEIIGDALPKPNFEEQIKDKKIIVNDKEWNLDTQGLPFKYEYKRVVNDNNTPYNSSDDKVESFTGPANKGIYNLYLYPLDEKVNSIKINDKPLNLNKEGTYISKVLVKEVVNDIGKEKPSEETLKPIYVNELSDSKTLKNTSNNNDATIGKFNGNGIREEKCEENKPHAHIDANTEFVKNGKSNLPLSGNPKIGLLWDDILPEVGKEGKDKLHNKSMSVLGEQFDSKVNVNNEFKYIDTVDMNDGNLWVSTKDINKKLTVYYPYPEGISKENEIAVTYFDNLKRDYTIMDNIDLNNEVENSNVEVLNVKKTDTGILFDISSEQRGLFEFIWKKKDIEKPVDPPKPEEPSKPVEPSKPNPNPDKEPDDEIIGDDRYDTAGQIADSMDYDDAIIVNAEYALADGLSAASLSGKEDAPILLTKKNEVPKSTVDRLKPTKVVYIIGGEDAISKDVENQIRKMGKNIVRLGGKNREETSYKVAEYLGSYDKAFVVNGYIGDADAISASAASARDIAPIILTNGKTSKYDKKKDVKYYAIGGDSVLDKSIVKKYSASQIAGKDRYETNRKFIKEFYPNSYKYYITKGDMLYDALTVSPIAKNYGVVLVSKKSDNTILVGKKIVQVGGMDFSIFPIEKK